MALPMSWKLDCHFCKNLNNLRRICNKRRLSNVTKTSSNARIFSGIQPTGVPHIGNYLGAIQNWVRLQDEYSDVIYSVVDLHSITVPQEPSVLRENIYTLTACLIASGIDPDRSILFQQSHVPQHTELGWILMCICSNNRLKTLPQWKEKSQGNQNVGVGLYNYPVLQAADILLYKSKVVPVGDDQVKHLELARDLARIFNNKFGKLFPEPDALLVGNTHRIKSLRDPSSKMSKSDKSTLGHVDITDTPDEIQEKFKKAVSDFSSEITYDPVQRPAISNLVDIYSGFTGLTPDEVCEESKHLDTLGFKLRVAEIVTEKFKPIKEEVNRLLGDKGHLDSILYNGYQKASTIAEETLNETKKLMGLS